jgi:hypothetical protein
VLRYAGSTVRGPPSACTRCADGGADPKRRFPIISDGGGVFFAYPIEDAAAATVAVERGQPGVYNEVDDDAAPVWG